MINSIPMHAAVKIGVILSGCGVRDGSELHEAVLSLLFLRRAGALPVCCAPDKPQALVVDHLQGTSLPGVRNILVESARIARGAIRSLGEVSADALDGAILPGGYGVSLNLSTFSQQGADCQVDASVAHLLRMLHVQGKPIGAMCIAPVILAKLFGSEHPVLTIGSDPKTAQAIETMGAVHRRATVREVMVDRQRRFVTTPAYMLARDITDAAVGIERLVAQVVQFAKASKRSSKSSRPSRQRLACTRG